MSCEGLLAELADFKLSDVEETGKELGRGAYGVVIELRVGRLECAGKTLHGLFFEASDCSRILERFIAECRQHSKLRHPHILQVLGIHYQPGSHAPMLVMEKMFTSLSECVEEYSNIPLHVKYRVLLDVGLGLDYLHSKGIVHRDLSANNVLLSESMRAKIADLGVAKIINFTPARMTTMSRVPGTPPYMPPEALVEKPDYSSELDVFSFGILVLHVIIQKWPIPNSPTLTPDPRQKGKFLTLTEEERRADHFKEMGEGHPLKKLVTDCIHNDRRCRPKISDIVVQLEKLVSKTSSDFSSTLQIYQKLKQKEEMIGRLKTQLYRVDAKLMGVLDDLDRLEDTKDQVKAKLCEISESTRSALEGREIVGHGGNGLVIAYKPPSRSSTNKEVLKITLDQAKGVPLSLAVCPPISIGFTGTFVRSFNAGLRGPTGIVFSNEGEIVVVDRDGYEGVHIFTANGEKVKALVPAAGFIDSPMPAEKCYYPHAVSCDAAGNIYLVDRGTNRVQKFDRNGALLAVAGKTTPGNGPLEFNNPVGIAIANDCEVYVCDKDNHRVQVLSTDLKFKRQFGSRGRSPNQFHHPMDIAFDSSGNVFVVDCSNYCLKIFSPGPENRPLRQIGKEGSQRWDFRAPVSIAIDRNDYIYVVEKHNHCVMVFNHGGEFMMLFGYYGAEDGLFDVPRGIAVNGDGLLCVTDYNNCRIQLFQ